MKRTTWGLLCACIDVVLIVSVGLYWYQIGCGLFSLIGGWVFYSAAVAALWIIGDDIIKGDKL